MRRFLAVSAAVLAGFGILTTSGSAKPASADSPNAVPAAEHAVNGWVGTWAAAPAAAVANTPDGYPGFSIRNVVHTSAGGGRTRVHLSNAFGAAPLTFGHVTIAVQATGPDAVPGTLRSLTFGGAPSVVVPAGAEALSDPADVRIPADANLLVTTYVPTKSGPVTYHPAASQTSYFTRAGDFAGSESGTPYTEQTSVWHYVSGVDVQGGAEASVVTLGDSITDGVGSVAGANHRWPDYLADRLHGRFGVLNEGISANRLLLDVPGSGAGQNALSRFDRDVLSVGGVRTLIVLEGINDIQQDPHQTDPNAITSAYRQLVTQAHARHPRPRRHAHAVQGLAGLRRDPRSHAHRGEHLHPHQWRLRRCRRLRRRRPRPGRPAADAARLRLRRPPPPGRRGLRAHGRRSPPRPAVSAG